MTDVMEYLEQWLISQYNEVVRIHNNLPEQFEKTRHELRIKASTLADVLRKIENTRKG